MNSWVIGPTLYERQEPQGDNKVTLAGKQQVPRWAVLAGIACLGAILIVIPSVYEWHSDHGVTSEIGMALLTAGVLGFTIHQWLAIDIAKDFLKAAMGYTLRPELRKEIDRIVYSEWLTTEPLLIVELSKVAEDLVKVKCSITRTLTNVTNATKPMKAWWTLDEWGVPGHPSTITVCNLMNGKEQITGTPQNLSPHSIEYATREVMVRPNHSVRLEYRGTQYKRINDLAYWTWLSPTVDQVVDVRSSDEIDFVVRPGRDEDDIKKEDISTRITIKGTILPYQHLGVRWWPKSQSESTKET